MAFPSVAAAFGLLLGFDVVAVRACGSKVARIFGVSAFADGHDLVDSGRGSSAAGFTDFAKVTITLQYLEAQSSPFVCVDEL